MADFVGSVASEDGIIWSLHLGNTASGLKGNTKYKVRPVGAESEVTTKAEEVPPTFTRRPAITATGTMVGTPLGGDNGAWTGNPMPTLKLVFWLKNGVVIPNENGGSLSTATGFTALDEIVRGVTIESVINGEPVTVTEYSLPFTLTAVQGVTVIEITDPIIAGQPVTVKFNTALSAAPQGNVTFTGSGDTWTFTAPADPSINAIFTAKATNFNDLRADYDVQVAPAALVREDNYAVLTNLNEAAPFVIGTPDDATDSIEGTYTFQPVAGKIGWVIDPKLTLVGGDVHVDYGALLVTDSPSNSAVSHEFPDGSGGMIWTPRAEDQGTTVQVDFLAVDSVGNQAAQSVSIAIPSATAVDTYDAANGTLLVPGPQESGETWDKMGSANAGPTIQGGYAVGGSNYHFVRRNDDVSSGNYKVTVQMRSTLDSTQVGYGDRGTHPAIGIKNSTADGFYFRSTNNANTLVIAKVAGGQGSTLKTRANRIPYNTDYTVEFVVTEHINVKVLIDGVEVPELAFSDPAIQGGAVGVWNAAAGGNVNLNKINSFAVETL